MFTTKPIESEKLSWVFVILWILTIYLCIPIARAMQRVVEQGVGREAFIWIVSAYLVLLTLFGFFYVFKFRLQGKSALRLFWLFICAALFAYWAWTLRTNPERTIHFVQYGTLSILMYRAFVHRIRSLTIFFLCVLACSIVGTLDEIIQWATPGRYFDYEDIFINFGAAALVQFGIALGIKPKIVNYRLRESGFSLFCNLAILHLLLLGATFSNTPDRVDRYASSINSLSFLMSNPSVMAEYGYKYESPVGGHLITRFSEKQLWAIIIISIIFLVLLKNFVRLPK
jgi:VanZ family protein